MRRKISLYIAGTLVDLDDQSFILFNYAREDLENPMVVKNSYSQPITIKGTPRNNKLFGDVFRLDRATQFGASYSGVYFDPMRKTPFAIYNELGEILESGYVKLDSIDRTGVDVNYNITLYGGIGSFFYSLMYKESGEKRSLADLYFYDGTTSTLAENISFPLSENSVYASWNALKYPNTGSYIQRNVLNFAPTYGGIPKDFKADKALYIPGATEYANLFVEKTDKAGNTYGQLTRDPYCPVAVNFSSVHTAEDVHDHRIYLQRPVLKMSAFLDAVAIQANNGSYDVTISQAVYDLVADVWMTLPLVDRTADFTALKVADYLRGTDTPASYLIGLIQMFGLVAYYDSTSVGIMTREEWFSQNSEVIDLTDRIDTKRPINITPFVMQHAFYEMKAGNDSAFAVQYKERFGFEYGRHIVNTGYPFDNETEDMTKNSPFKGAVDQLMYNPHFAKYTNDDGLILSVACTDTATITLYSISHDADFTKEFPVDGFGLGLLNMTPYNSTYEWSDGFPKLQLFGKDDKTIDGANVLVIYNGCKDVIQGANEHLSSDEIFMDGFFGGPCWTLSGGTAILFMPQFTRCEYDSSGNVERTMDYGVPAAVEFPYKPTFADDATIFASRWASYMTDRYDVDTKLIHCYVNLAGLDVEQLLLSRLFYYDNALWVLNRVMNHSMTTYDLTECEFVKVKDINNYTN